jgi:hypothetical protein
MSEDDFAAALESVSLAILYLKEFRVDGDPTANEELVQKA